MDPRARSHLRVDSIASKGWLELLSFLRSPLVCALHMVLSEFQGKHSRRSAPPHFSQRDGRSRPFEVRDLGEVLLHLDCNRRAADLDHKSHVQEKARATGIGKCLVMSGLSALNGGGYFALSTGSAGCRTAQRFPRRTVLQLGSDRGDRKHDHGTRNPRPWRQVRGESHPKTFAARADLAGAHQEMGNYATAESLYALSSAGWDRFGLKDDPRALAARLSTATLLRETGLYEEAEREFQELLTVLEADGGEGRY